MLTMPSGIAALFSIGAAMLTAVWLLEDVAAGDEDDELDDLVRVIEATRPQRRPRRRPRQPLPGEPPLDRPHPRCHDRPPLARRRRSGRDDPRDGSPRWPWPACPGGTRAHDRDRVGSGDVHHRGSRPTDEPRRHRSAARQDAHLDRDGRHQGYRLPRVPQHEQRRSIHAGSDGHARTTTTSIDVVVGLGTRYYVLQSYYGSWTSVNSNQDSADDLTASGRQATAETRGGAARLGLPRCFLRRPPRTIRRLDGDSMRRGHRPVAVRTNAPSQR